MRYTTWPFNGLLLISLAVPLTAAGMDDHDPARDRVAAEQLLAADKPEEALAIYEQLVEAHPDNAEYLTGLGRAQLQDHKALAASRTLRAVIDRHPNHEPAYPLLQQAYYASGQSERAFSILQEARERFGEQPWMQD